MGGRERPRFAPPAVVILVLPGGCCGRRIGEAGPQLLSGGTKGDRELKDKVDSGSQLLGHEKLETTAIYTEVTIRQLIEVHARCYPSAQLPAAGKTAGSPTT